MEFTDVTLEAGRIRSRRSQDTSVLAREPVRVCSQWLEQLRGGVGAIECDLGDCAFVVGLGMPPTPGLDSAWGAQPEYRHLFWVSTLASADPFQYNIVFGPRTAPAVRNSALHLITACSLWLHVTEAKLERSARAIQGELGRTPRLLATAPVGWSTSAAEGLVVRVASDFATCFAAAWLEEEENR